MRAIGKVLSCIATIVIAQTVGIYAAQAATYTATQVDTGTVLRNNNGSLVKQTSTSGPGPDTENSTSTVTVTSAGRILATYNSPVGTTDHILAINDAEAVVGYRSVSAFGRSH